MPVLKRAKPGVLKLFFTPKATQGFALVSQFLATSRRRGRIVEQSTVSVEDARTGMSFRGSAIFFYFPLSPASLCP